MWAVGLLAVASGVSLLIGYLTPAGCILAVVISSGDYFSWFQTPSPNLFETRIAAALAVSIAVALICLGPGAFSIDARLFGRHEIIITEVPHPPAA